MHGFKFKRVPSITPLGTIAVIKIGHELWSESSQISHRWQARSHRLGPTSLQR